MPDVLGPHGQECRLLPTLTDGGFGPLFFAADALIPVMRVREGVGVFAKPRLRLTGHSRFGRAFKRHASSEKGLCAVLCGSLCGFVRFCAD